MPFVDDSDMENPVFFDLRDHIDFLTFRINQLCNYIDDMKAEHDYEIKQLRQQIFELTSKKQERHRVEV